MIDAGTYGAMNWVDLSTPDIAAATEFYSKLLGWTVEKSTTPMGEYFVSSPPVALDYLIRCIEGDEEPVANIQEALKSFRLAMATYEAARKGAAVQLNL